MNFLIADTFTDALARLPAQEQKAAKTSAFDLQLDPSAPGLQFHRIDKSKDQNFWSMRVNRDLRQRVRRARDQTDARRNEVRPARHDTRGENLVDAGQRRVSIDRLGAVEEIVRHHAARTATAASAPVAIENGPRVAKHVVEELGQARAIAGAPEARSNRKIDCVRPAAALSRPATPRPISVDYAEASR